MLHNQCYQQEAGCSLIWSMVKLVIFSIEIFLSFFGYHYTPQPSQLQEKPFSTTCCVLLNGRLTDFLFKINE